MQPTRLFFLNTFLCCLFLLSACGTSTATIEAQAADIIASPDETQVNPTSAPSATELIPSPTPTATPVPPLPCNITFESDRDGNLEIYRMDPDGSNPLNLTNNPADDTDPVWSPDGAHIAFVSNRPNDSGGGKFIYGILADGTDVVQLSNQNDSNFPDWSPDGNRIAYNSKGDIFLINISEGTEVNLTNNPEEDEQPKFSPDGQHIAWLKGSQNDRQIYVMDLDGSNVQQVTHSGKVNGVEWTVDGRLFTHWENPDGICFNCVVTADGKDVIDAGGKGTIQQFLPFWTVDGQRVEMASGPGPNGDDEIFLVSEIFPDLFLYLTNNPAHDRNPDTAAMCGPAITANPVVQDAPGENDQTSSPDTMIIGYEDQDGILTAQMQQDLDRACAELDVQCIRGDDIASLAAQNVNAIISVSSRWHIMGSAPQLHDAVMQDIPVFVLNAESTESGAFNLSVENETITTTLKWMFKQMGGQGEFVAYNFGNSNYHQQLMDAVLKEYPGIQASHKPADYNGTSFTEEDIANLIATNPNLGAIWTNENYNDLFWGINSTHSDHLPLAVCMPRMDILTAWKNSIDAGSPFQCLAYIKPGGTAYEGVYVAYYFLNGLQIKPEALTGEGGNTLRYEIPEITNQTLPEWIAKVDSFRVGQGEALELPPMTPDEILEKWFVE